jgi:hypothetical protein
MKTLCIVAVVILAGCGSHIAPTGMTGAGFASPATHGKSWMLPGTYSGSDLLYVSNGYIVYVFTYPQTELVGELTGLDAPEGMCSDSNGDVFISTFWGKQIVEYSHGGTSPIATLDDGDYDPNECAVDSVSGNLAVANSQSGPGGAGSIAIYAKAQGDPTFYTAANIYSYNFCSYDSNGNLFADGWNHGTMGLAEMPEGSGAFGAVSLNKSLYPDSLQWDGKYLALASPLTRKGPLPIYRVQVTGSVGTIVGESKLWNSRRDRNSYQPVQYWIQGNIILGQNERVGLGLWRYPSGGKPTGVVKPPKGVLGVTVSLAQSLFPHK